MRRQRQRVRRGHMDDRPVHGPVDFRRRRRVFRVLQEEGTRLVVVMVEKQSGYGGIIKYYFHADGWGRVWRQTCSRLLSEP